MNYSYLLDGPTEVRGHFPACFAFSIHKSGSTLMFNMIRDACAAANVPAISFPDLFFREGVFDHEWRNDRQLLDYVVSGRLYFGFRYLPEVLRDPAVQLRSRRSVLLVRDPRDALVSQYFSFGGSSKSHRLPEKHTEQWESMLKSGEQANIDEYVLNAAPSLLGKLTVYKDQLFTENLQLHRYEQVYYDKRKFLGDIFTHFNITAPNVVLDQVAARHDIRPVVENPSNHIRQGTPGDHRRKLRPETIAQLNERFREVCQWFGYDLAAESKTELVH